MNMIGVERTSGNGSEAATGFAAVGREPAPIDLIHLARQTFGSSDLERDVLNLFVQQGAGLARRIAEAANATERGELAHRLKGSAFAVGAVRVGRLAQALESAVTPVEIRGLSTDLAQAVEEVERFVASLLAPAA